VNWAPSQLVKLSQPSKPCFAALTPQALPELFPLYAAVTLAGTFLGATIGIRYLPPNRIVAVPGMVLGLSGAKLILS